jgi:Aspartyl protease
VRRSEHDRGWRLGAIPAAFVAFAACARADEPASATEAASAAPPQVIVEAPEPLYVAPTRRDRIGRIWAPVLINERGPFRLVLDTGASRSAINASVAAALGIDGSSGGEVMLLGVTGELEVSAVTVDSFVVGDLELRPARLPIIADAFGGAEGVLGTDGLLDKRIVIDFQHDSITIARSHGRRAPRGYVTIPVRIEGGLIIVDDARFGSLPVQAIVDTGGQASIANPALGEALRRRIRQQDRGVSEIVGITLDVKRGDLVSTPPLMLGDLRVGMTEITVADFYLFQHWKMTSRPAVMIGMDILGLLDALIIDYPRQELQVKLGRR